MRRLALAALLSAVACGRPLEFEPYRDDARGFSLEVPAGWPRETRPASGNGPIVETRFIGSIEPQDEGEPLGAVLSVTRRRELPAGPPPPEGRYARDYEHGGPTPFHSRPATPMRVEGRAFRGRDAFFLVELRGARDRFDRFRPALDRALATFRPAP